MRGGTWRWVLCVLGAAATAAAQPAPTPTEQPQPNAPASPAVVVGRPLTEHTVDRTGPVVLAGFMLITNASLPRIDVIVPVRLPSAPQFRVGMMAAYEHASGSIGTTDVDGYSLLIAPTAYYDWRLPIATSAGDFVVSVEGGIMYGTVWLKLDQPYMPGTYQRLTGYDLRFASALQFRAHNGLVLSVQPLGFMIPVITPTVPKNSMLQVTTQSQWEGALLCGYQF